MSELAALQDAAFATATAATRQAYPADRRLDAVTLDRFLDRHAFAVVATTRSDGRPHAAVSRYIRRGAVFWLPTMAGSVRERNLRAQPALTLVVTDGEHDAHVAVLVEGDASVIEAPAAPADVRAEHGDADWVSVWIRVIARRVLSYAAEDARLG